MAQTRGTFSSLYDNIDKALFTLAFDNFKSLPALWKQVYTIRTSDKKFERVQSVVGMADVPEKGEGNPYTTDILQPGWTKDFTHAEFGLAFRVTEAALEDDQYDQLAQHARWMMLAARVTEEKRAHLLFNNGFASETSPDGVVIFSASHALKVGPTASNTLATAADLSATQLELALIDIVTNTYDEAGHLMLSPQSLVLFVPPALEFTAERILMSNLRPGVGDNDVNAIKTRRDWKIVVSPYLTDADAWFVLSADKAQHGFVSYTRVPMTMKPRMVDPATGDLIYPIRFRRSWGVSHWQGSYGVPGV
jgi:hypothetical protein